MQRDTADKKPDVMDQFNEILFKHLKHLIGSKYGIGELILNLVTISIITLLTERENEIENFPSEEIDRYTNETLIKDIEEMGFDDTQDMNIFIEDMIQKDYIHMDDDRLIPQKPTISMSRLMDLVFPKMPGMSLIAYFIQTIDEVKSNRKDIDTATDQFNQLLHMQGIPLEKDPKEHEASKVSAQFADNKPPIHKPDNSPKNSINVSPNKEIKSLSILGRKSHDNLIDRSKGSSKEPKVLSSDAFNGKITKLIFGESGSKETEPDKDERTEDEKLQASGKLIETAFHDADEPQNAETEMMIYSEEPTRTDFDYPVQKEETSAANTRQHDSIQSVEEAAQDLKSTKQDENNFYNDKDKSSNKASDQNKSETVEEKVEDIPQARDKEDDVSLNSAIFSTDKDDDIEKRIMAFEEDLALECPLCRQSKVLTESTATGKLYYKCSNKGCSFISWGKPHHIFCPKCNNPFLIETSSKVGTINLKCPRATCRYWKKVRSDVPTNGRGQMDYAVQTPNESASISQKSRRRVVRRRVVRRKK